ncbi:protein phosphatase 1 regulatory subunit 36 isoform X2 [Pseudophryne corroboree]|uniref:protein phosphatase 1 regulatory subunit 36 isoform X2 n=2 Tax=Pseudophryne corroboree TaxID=495146 RepID=UPI0030815BCC
MELVTRPTPGQWFWKEDSKTLEFSGTIPWSNNMLQNARHLVEKVKSERLLESGSSKSDSTNSSGSKSQERSFSVLVTKSPRQAKKRDGNVTLEDVKRVALKLLQEDERLCMTSFLETERTQQIDTFLMALLYYLSCYLENAQYEKKPKFLTPNVIFLKHKEGVQHKRRTEFALKHFGYMYCNLILGEGMSDQHHMACGKSRASATQRDRRFYESLYSFCICAGWVVFRRKGLEVIEAEVGRLMRSSTFNPALKMNDAPPEPGRTTKKTTYAENRMVTPKRPSIKSFFTQRSPLLTSVMPRPNERSQYLYQRHTLHPEGCSEPKGPTSWMQMFPAEILTGIGIIGEPLRNYYYHNLIPVFSDDEEEPETQEKKSTERPYSRGLSSHQSHFRPGTGRQSEVISRATTEAAYSDIY